MEILIAFAATLLLAVLVSGMAQRSVLSAAVLFLIVGFVVGRGVFHVAPFEPTNPLVDWLATATLYSVLFTDGMRVGVSDLVSTWRLPGRALLLGFPLTLVGNTILARFLVGLPWTEAILLGAVLTPTDPVFAAAIVGSEHVPSRVRFLLNVESGLNDGLALPIVVVMLDLIRATPVEPGTIAVKLVLGIALGIGVTWLVLRLERFQFFSPASSFEPYNAFALGLLVFGLASIIGANIFLAAFTAGITVASVNQQVRNAFSRFGDFVTELLKLFTLLLFGALISPTTLATRITPRGFLFGFLAILVVRPVVMAVALLGSRIGLQERLVAGWFGPKGFASLVYGILMLNTGVPQGPRLFHLVAIAVAVSIVINSSTDVLAVRWLQRFGQQIDTAAQEREEKGEVEKQASGDAPGPSPE
jgi:NhaP-type Na+/H+ or K+/H+ antiporter